METKQKYDLIGDELLIAVFNFFIEKDNLNFKDESYIVNAFYKASIKLEYKELFKNYHFDIDGIVPYSREVSDGIDILHQTSLIAKWNPSFAFYKISKGVEKRYSKYIEPNLDSDQIELIKKLSEDIRTDLIRTL